MPTQESDELLAVVQQLRSENAALRAELDSGSGGAPPADTGHTHWKRDSWWWTVLATVLIVIGSLLAPVALIGSWAERVLTNTDSFVNTFAPLADDPAVQAYIADEVTTAINENVDIPQITSDLVDGIASLGLKPRAEAALRALEGPAVQAIDSLIHNTVSNFVASPQFANLFETTLRVSHEQLIATMQGQPNAILAIGENGTIGLQLGPVIAQVKTVLVEHGIGIAAQIPDVNKTIVIATADSLPLAQNAYRLAIALGTWLPWLTILLLAAGVIVARRRARALIWAAIALAISVLLTLAGVGIARPIVVGVLSPSVMPSDAATVIYGAVVSFIASAALAVAVLAVTVAILGWLAGPFPLARRLRAAGASVAASIRVYGERHRLTTGAAGEWLYRMRVLFRVLVAFGGAAIVLFVRPLSPPLIIWTAVLCVAVIALLEVLQRPTPATQSS